MPKSSILLLVGRTRSFIEALILGQHASCYLKCLCEFGCVRDSQRECSALTGVAVEWSVGWSFDLLVHRCGLEKAIHNL
ncbi:hypothetical protein BDV35DRAFT_279770 [Aspergillus flavus]|uniref:Uncharacterized protein n=1 Tax=Aspergillus flavus TaxID=5059 RepID=A0A5N6GSA6_ASPFL|nr:hypothetical protein BDV35DRAFT_279770 [Aspergillus flavus]